MIIDDCGRLIWFEASAIANWRWTSACRHYHGEPVLTWWRGRLIGGEGAARA